MTEYGIQMYSIRDIAKTDLEGALRTVSELGYRYVEFAGFFGHPAKAVKAWLDRYGLLPSGTHTPPELITPDTIGDTITYHKEIGCSNLIVPGADWWTKEKAEANIALLNAAQKTLAENGIALGYHNHSMEFQPTPYGTIVEDELLNRTAIEPELDIFWAYNAGVDPIAFLEAHKKRVRVIHLKDGFPAPDGSLNAAGKALGEGSAPIVAVRDWAIRNGVRIVVESEGLDPSGAEEIGRCIRYLRTLE